MFLFQNDGLIFHPLLTLKNYIMKNFILCFFFLALSFPSVAQLAPNFTINSNDGQTHTLYDYLDQGHSVVLDIMFVDCGPCQTLTPYLDGLYQEWGSGNADVQFFSITPYDTNAELTVYDNTYGATYHGAGTDGGSEAAIDPYWSNMFGEFTGFPTIVIIAPDRTVDFDVWGIGYEGTMQVMRDIFTENGATGQVTTTPTCNDGIQNGNETGVDCGGTCPPCNTSGCNPPTPTPNIISGKCVKLDWADEPIVEKYKVRYRLPGASWTEYNANYSQTFFNDLALNTTYEYQVKTDCGSENSAWSATATFTTSSDNCDRPTTIAHSNLTAVTADVNWTTTPNDLKYKVSYKGSSGGWTQVFVNVPNLDVTISNLQSGRSYSYRVKTKCSGGWTNWTPKSTFLTTPLVAREINPQWNTTVYPNPANETLNVQYELKTIGSTTIQIFDIVGKVMLTKQIEHTTGLNRIQLDISQLHKGNYILNISNNESQVVQKFVKL